MSDKIALLRAFFRKRGLGYDVNMKKAQREEIKAKRLALVSKSGLDKMSMSDLRNFMESLCHDPSHPEHNYLFCLCTTCNPISHCVDYPCDVCDGPVTECEPPDDEEIGAEEEKEE